MPVLAGVPVWAAKIEECTVAGGWPATIDGCNSEIIA